jgi:polar amino acid transport system substrate-binding protein
MRTVRTLGVTLSILALVAAGCANDNNTGGGGGSSKANTLLGQVKSRGTLRVATDPAYPPQSSYDEKSQKWQGFDVDVANELAKRLGVKLQFVTPSWDLITAGSWNGRWDVSVGSMTPIADRQKVLDFTPPYYFVPAVVVVKNDSSFTSFDQLSGKKIGSCDPCTYSFYIKRTLNIPGFPANYVLPTDMKFTGYDTDSTALENLQLGRLDAVLTSLTTADGAIKAGKPLKILGDPVFFEPDSIAVDKSASADPGSLVAALANAVKAMHNDGTLTALSKKWFGGLDLTVAKPTG